MHVQDKHLSVLNLHETNNQTPAIPLFEQAVHVELGLSQRELLVYKKQQSRN